MEEKTRSFTTGKSYLDPAKAVKAYRDIQMMIAALKEEAERLKVDIILPDMAGAEQKEYKANNTIFKVSNKVVHSERVDEKKVKEVYSDWREKAMRTSDAPRFTVK